MQKLRSRLICVVDLRRIFYRGKTDVVVKSVSKTSETLNTGDGGVCRREGGGLGSSRVRS
jgi:hypothetical protein